MFGCIRELLEIFVLLNDINSMSSCCVYILYQHKRIKGVLVTALILREYICVCNLKNSILYLFHSSVFHLFKFKV